MTCSVELTISASTKNQYLTPNSISYSDPIDARTNLSFSLRVPTSDTFIPRRGHPVYLANASSTMFGGMIDNITEQMIYGSSYVQYNIACVDWTAICDRRICNKSYTSSGYDADIIVDLASTFLDGEGVTCNNVTTGKIIASDLNFNYQTVTQAFNEIAKRTGRNWYIDPAKDIHYFARTEMIAPMQIGSTTANWRKTSVRRSRDQYKNTEYVQNTYLTINSTEYFLGDGYTQTFNCTYPLYSEPTVFVGASSRSVGILDIDSGKQFYWKKDSNAITQPTTDVAVGSTYIKVSYVGSYSVVTKVQDDEEIGARKDIEGGSGIYETVENANKTYGEQSCLDIANSELSKYGRMPDYITFETDEDGLKSGQLIWVQLPDHHIEDYYYITSISAKDVDMVRMRYQVTAISGQERGGWSSFFRKLTETKTDYSTPFDILPLLYSRRYNANISIYIGATITSTPIVGYYVDDPACLVGTATVS